MKDSNIDPRFYIEMIKSKEYSLINKKVMICHYFDELCNNSEFIDLLGDPKYDFELKKEILKNYKRKNIKDQKYLEDRLRSIVRSKSSDKDILSESILYLSRINPAHVYEFISKGDFPDRTFHYAKILLAINRCINQNRNFAFYIFRSNVDRMFEESYGSRVFSRLFHDLVYLNGKVILGNEKIVEFAEAEINSKIDLKNYLKKRLDENIKYSGFRIYEQIGQFESISLLLSSEEPHISPLSDEELDHLKYAIKNQHTIIVESKGRKTFLPTDKFYTIIPCCFMGKVVSVLFFGFSKKPEILDLIYLTFLSKVLGEIISNLNKRLHIQKYYTNFLQIYEFVIASLRHETSRAVSGLTGVTTSLISGGHFGHDSALVEEIVSAKNTIEETVSALTSLVDDGTYNYRLNDIIINFKKSIETISNKHNINYQFTFCKENPPVNYKSVLFVVLSNFVKNSISAFDSVDTQKRTIAITTKKENNYIEITFSDNGPGIKPEIRPYVFDLGATTSGSGVGLALVKMLVEAIGGRISLAGEAGACFEIELPLEA